MIVPVLRGELLDLVTVDDFVKRSVDREDVRAYIAQRASVLLRRQVRVRFSVRGAEGGEDDPMNALKQKQQQYPELIHIRD